MKECIICKIIKDIDDFYKNKKSKDGYEGKCKICNKKLSKESAQRNKEQVKKNHKKWRDNNKEKEIIRIMEYQVNNKKSIINYRKKWYSENQDYVKDYRESYKETRRIKDKERKSVDNLYRLTCNVRSSIRRGFLNKGYKKNTKTYKILGCSFEELKKHIESQWEDWMSWDNYGLYNGEYGYGWDIDHILPLSTAINEGDVIRLNHFTNLQPLCSYTNRVIKRNSIS